MTLKWSADGMYDFEVTGESYYQNDLKRLAGGERRKQTIARLVCESKNPHDAQAVRVEIGGKTIGHLSREDAREHRRKLAALKQAGAIVECPAVIVSGKEEIFGVYLDLPEDDDVDEIDRAAARPIGPKVSPLRLTLIMIGLFVVSLICVAAQNASMTVACLAVAAWLVWQWRRSGGRWIR